MINRCYTTVFLTGEEFTQCFALGHTDTSMTKKYTNVDKVILRNAYPEIQKIIEEHWND